TQRADVASPVDARVVQAQVGSFIQSARMVTADVELQKQAIFRVYGMLAPNDPALAKMTDYLNGNPDNTPFARAARETVSVEIASVIQQTKTSWQVDWTETERDRQGQPIQPPAKMRALVTIRVAPPSSATTEEQIKQNPLGKIAYFAAALAALPSIASAQDGPPLPDDMPPANAPMPAGGGAQVDPNAYISPRNPNLTRTQREGLSIARRWQAESAEGIKPVPGTEGAVLFAFGTSEPS
ncbi:hypothetical protein KXV85_000964, partial [Aspergillus fumigatus]